ncbi:amino acid ABC transporter substrate-binding protein [Thiococcus pfennigii]|uniref:amino acid ABC transporter substrate-binding protein n=1 Tax=Thiococcus pfennigii TaxID=1057 RepID=UPI001F5BF567|nr:amino acid ABC transporter substrate-binding protein [Thiococcus pfennigii]
MMMKPRFMPWAAAILIAALAQTALADGTLATVKERGFLQCGVNTGLPGFSNADEKGSWTGLDVDLCRAVAAAVLGGADKVRFTPLTAKERLTAVQSGEVDLLARNTTWTMTRDTSLGVHFAGINYYDGQGFLVSKDLGVKSARELDGAAVCILAGTTTELNLADYFRTHGMTYEPVVFDTADQTARGFESERCDVLTSDQSQLYAQRLKLAAPDKAVVLPEIISKEPLGPVVRQGDDRWLNIVRWTLFALIEAEELGVTSGNVDAMRESRNPAIRRLLGLEGIKGSGLGLDEGWAYRAIEEVGNYGEIFARNVGEASPLKIERGLNRLWTDGGLHYAPPIR